MPVLDILWILQNGRPLLLVRILNADHFKTTQKTTSPKSEILKKTLKLLKVLVTLHIHIRRENHYDFLNKFNERKKDRVFHELLLKCVKTDVSVHFCN